MIEFKISAPGRIILSGEYAAIYEKTIVISTLNRRTTLKFAELINNSKKMIKIEFPDVDISLNLPWELVENFYYNNDFMNLMENEVRLFKAVQYFITSNGMWSTYEQKFSLQVFFFLFFYIAHKEKLDIKPFYVHLTTQLPMNANLGSSKSFAVCLAACFLHWSRLQTGDHNEFNSHEILQISKYAMYGMEPIYTFKSMVHTFICVLGKVTTKFQHCNNQICPRSHENIFINTPQFKILLIDLKIRQNKNEQIEQLAKLKYFFPEFVDNIMNDIGKISKNIFELLQIIANIPRNDNLLQFENAFADLKKQIGMNQHKLSVLNLSPPFLHHICSVANDYGFEGKLTGMGENKFAYILLPPDISEDEINNISTHIEGEDLNVMTSYICCEGVRIDD